MTCRSQDCRVRSVPGIRPALSPTGLSACSQKRTMRRLSTRPFAFDRAPAYEKMLTLRDRVIGTGSGGLASSTKMNSFEGSNQKDLTENSRGHVRMRLVGRFK